jgi:adenylate kinase family enzyme
MQRIVVIGTSGSGKSTLARKIARLLSFPCIELDALHWGPNWTPHADFAQRVESAIRAIDAWVIEGNYGVVRPIIWPRADTIVWLDYPMTTVFTRVFKRTWLRWWRREILWSGNRERMWDQFCTQESLLLWVIQTWRTHRRTYPALFRTPEYSGKKIIRLRSPRDAERWIASLQN